MKINKFKEIKTKQPLSFSRNYTYNNCAKLYISLIIILVYISVQNKSVKSLYSHCKNTLHIPTARSLYCRHTEPHIHQLGCWDYPIDDEKYNYFVAKEMSMQGYYAT